jgi:ribosomal protein L29
LAKKDKKESYATMSAAELSARLREAQETQFRMQFRHASNPLKNPMEIRINRREIARLQTWLRQKEEKA